MTSSSRARTVGYETPSSRSTSRITPRFLMKTSTKSICAPLSLSRAGGANSPSMEIEQSGHRRRATVRFPSHDGHLRIIGRMVDNIDLIIKIVKSELKIVKTRINGRAGGVSGASGGRGRGVLLAQAMNGAEAPDQVRRRDANDAAAGQESGERRGRDGIGGGVEGRHHDCAISYIKVRVGGGQARAVVDDGRGHRESFDFEGAAVLIAHRAQAREVVAQDRVVHVGGIVLEDGDDSVRGDEAREVVD